MPPISRIQNLIRSCVVRLVEPLRRDHGSAAVERRDELAEVDPLDGRRREVRLRARPGGDCERPLGDRQGRTGSGAVWQDESLEHLLETRRAAVDGGRLRHQGLVELGQQLALRHQPDGDRRPRHRYGDRDRGEQHQPEPEAHGCSRSA
jgi:hypothetical protein